MWVNNVTLIGRIAEEPKVYTVAVPQEEEETGIRSIVNVWLLTMCTFVGEKRRMMRMQCKFLGANAARFLRQAVKNQDWLYIEGSLDVRSYKPEQGDGYHRFVFVRVKRWLVLYGPPNKFVRGHALVPVDELRRLRPLAGYVQDTMVTSEKLREFGILKEGDPDVQSGILPDEEDSDDASPESDH